MDADATGQPDNVSAVWTKKVTTVQVDPSRKSKLKCIHANIFGAVTLLHNQILIQRLIVDHVPTFINHTNKPLLVTHVQGSACSSSERGTLV